MAGCYSPADKANSTSKLINGAKSLDCEINIRKGYGPKMMYQTADIYVLPKVRSKCNATGVIQKMVGFKTPHHKIGNKIYIFKTLWLELQRDPKVDCEFQMKLKLMTINVVWKAGAKDPIASVSGMSDNLMQIKLWN